MRYRHGVVAVVAVANGSNGLCYSARLIEPFLRVLADDAKLADAALAALRPVDPDTRVPIARAH